MRIQIKRLNERAKLPQYASKGAACFDIAACTSNPVSIYPGESAVLPTGLAFEVPEGFVMKLYSRSGHGFKHGARLANCVGVIDSDYRGEVMAKIHNDGDKPFIVEPGERILQGSIEPVIMVGFEEVAELSDTERGQGGFGSTGKV